MVQYHARIKLYVIAVSHHVQCWQRKLEFMRKSSEFGVSTADMFQYATMFIPYQAWCGVILEWAKDYLVPEASIRLRLVGKYPCGCGGRGHLSRAALL